MKTIGALRARVEKLDIETSFRLWLRQERIRSLFTVEQNEALADGRIDIEAFPEPPWGKSPLDKLDRRMLKQRWEMDLLHFGDRSDDELEFYIVHGHWPDTECEAWCATVRPKTF